MSNPPPALSRRSLLGVAAAGGAAAVAAAAPAYAVPNRPSRRVQDSAVIVVGAGLAGLSAATRIHRAGRSVVVLEARDRVGGRNFDIEIAPGKVVEMGGEWTGPGQHRVQALAKRYGIKTFETYAAGENIYYNNGSVSTYSGGIPPARPDALAELEAVIVELNNMAQSVAADKPWRASQAATWDILTIDQWAHGRCTSAEARRLVDVAVRGVYGEDASQISLLDLLAAITGVGGDFNTLIGDAQSTRFVGGPQQMSKHLARDLGHRVLLRHVVDHIETARHSVTVHTHRGVFRARELILTAPKPAIARIRFTPDLHPVFLQYLQRQPMGATIKVNAIYETPFWREQGLSGSVVSDDGPIEVVYDNSPPDGKPGVLVGFMEGRYGRKHLTMTKTERRKAALACFARYFGKRALRATAYHDMVWAHEPYSLGAYGTFNPPGVLTGLGPLLKQPAPNVHIAGADSSPSWPGYMDGAIGSGDAAARGVLKRL